MTALTFKKRLFLIINLTVFIDTLLYGIIVPAVPYYVQKFEIGETLVGTIFFAYSAGLLLSSVPIGLLCDRVGRKKVLVSGAIGLATATLIYMVSDSLYLLMFSRFLQGVASSATWTAGLALAAEIFPTSRGQKLGMILSMAGLGTIVGPAFGGLLYKFLGYSYPFAIIAVFALAPVVLLLKQDKEEMVQDKKHEVGGQPSGIKVILENRNILWGATTICISSFGFGVMDPILPLHLSERFSLTSEGIGIIFAIMGIAYTLSQPVMGGFADKMGRKKIIVFGLFMAAFVAPFVTLAQTLIIEGLVVCALGLATGMISAPCLPLMAESIGGENADSNGGTDSMYGMAFGVLNTAYSLGLVIGPIVGGVVTEKLNFTYAMSIYSVLLVVVAAGVMRYVWETLNLEPKRAEDLIGKN